MTNSEVIEYLEDYIAPPRIGSKFVGNGLIESVKIAIECVEKQIPKKPVLENTKGIFGIDMWHCPVCKDEIISDWNRDIANPYCHHCGQAIDWSDNK